MRRALALSVAVLALPVSAQAQEALASFEWFSLEDGGAHDGEPTTFDGPALPEDWTRISGDAQGGFAVRDGALAIMGNSVPLAGDGAPSMYGTAPASADFSAQTLLHYHAMEEGDVAGLAAMRGPDRWLSIQVEIIEPADLIAVRRRADSGDPPGGKLVYTTALPGSFGDRVKLRLDVANGEAMLLYSGGNGLWQVLAEDIDVDFLLSAGSSEPGTTIVGPYAVDGAE